MSVMWVSFLSESGNTRRWRAVQEAYGVIRWLEVMTIAAMTADSIVTRMETIAVINRVNRRTTVTIGSAMEMKGTRVGVRSA